MPYRPRLLSDKFVPFRSDTSWVMGGNGLETRFYRHLTLRVADRGWCVVETGVMSTIRDSSREELRQEVEAEARDIARHWPPSDPYVPPAEIKDSDMAL